MDGSARGTRAPRPGPAAVLLLVLVAVALTAALPGASAAFSAAAATPGNALSADQLAPPSGLSAVQTCSTPAAITFRAAGTATGMDALTLAAPAGTVAGDVLVAQVAFAHTTAAPTVTAGWTLVRRDNSANVVESALFSKVAGTGEPGVTFSFPTGTGSQMAGGIAAYSGVSATTPVDAHNGVVGYGRTAVTPSVTSTTANTVLVRLITNVHEAYPAPTGTTQRWRLAVGGWSGGGVTAGDEPFVGPGATGTRSSASPSGTDAYGIGQTVALRRGPGTPSAVLTWTASPSTWATGYRLERTGGAAPAGRTVTPGSATTTADGPLVNGTSYSFTLRAQRGTWTSPPAATTLTPSC